MCNILVSIIIPVYNIETYLKRCLESIAAQKVTGYEVIIIDDESSDDTLQVAQASEEMFDNIQILKQEHAGQSTARNLGISKARGKYVTFIDGDDYWEEDHLQRLFDVLTTTDCDMAIGTQYNVIQNDRKDIVYMVNNPEVMIGNPEILFREKIIIGSMWMATCKKWMLEKHSIRFTEEYSCNEDFDFILSCTIHAEKVALLNWNYYNYFRDNLNSTYVSLNGSKIMVYMQVCQKWYDYFLNHFEQYTYSDNVLKGITRHSFWALNQMNELPKNDPAFSALRQYLKDTRYIFWPDNKNKNVEVYIWKKRLHIKKCTFINKCKRVMKEWKKVCGDKKKL